MELEINPDILLRGIVTSLVLVISSSDESIINRIQVLFLILPFRNFERNFNDIIWCCKKFPVIKIINIRMMYKTRGVTNYKFT